MASEEADALLFDSSTACRKQAGLQQNPAAAGRKAREAEFAVRLARVVLCKQQNGAGRGLRDTIDLVLVDVREVAVKAEGEQVDWRLLATDPVTSLEDARRIVGLYGMRWTMEEFFRTLKIGRLRHGRGRYQRASVHDQLNESSRSGGSHHHAARQSPRRNHRRQLADAFERADRRVLEAISTRLEGKTARQKNPYPEGYLAFAAWVIARLGGWTGYYGKPGPQVMRRGLDDFSRIKFGATLSLKDV